MDLPDTSDLQQQIARSAKMSYEAPYVNQTKYRPIQSLIAVSIETKTRISGQDPLYQLGIWTAAWYRRMENLRSASSPVHLVTLPLIQVNGHAWEMYFACDQGSSIDLFDPLPIGGTDSIASTFALLNSLQAVKTWIERSFFEGMKTWFKREDAPVPSAMPGIQGEPSDSPDELAT